MGMELRADLPVSKSGIADACAAAGGQTQLARAVGVKQGHVWDWLQAGKPPADRCPAIEAATGVHCEELRPDLAWIRDGNRALGYATPLEGINPAQLRRCYSESIQTQGSSEAPLELDPLREGESPAMLALREAIRRAGGVHALGEETEWGAENFVYWVNDAGWITEMEAVPEIERVTGIRCEELSPAVMWFRDDEDHVVGYLQGFQYEGSESMETRIARFKELFPELAVPGATVAKPSGNSAAQHVQINDARHSQRQDFIDPLAISADPSADRLQKVSGYSIAAYELVPGQTVDLVLNEASTLLEIATGLWRDREIAADDPLADAAVRLSSLAHLCVERALNKLQKASFACRGVTQ